jgi:putative ABC transport system ATP-binding protein
MGSDEARSDDLGSVTDDLPKLVIDQLEIDLGSQTLRFDSRCEMRAGRLFLLWGPSGSGKSSFARALLGLGLLAKPPVPVRGQVELFDAAGGSNSLWQGNHYAPDARERIAFFPQAERLGFLDNLSTMENLCLFSRLPPAEAENHARRLATRFHLGSLPTRVSQASGGERIRLSAVRGLIPRAPGAGPPVLVIADEPTAGLDPTAAATLAREFMELARRGDSIVVVITHDPRYFLGEPSWSGTDDSGRKTIRILECALTADGRTPKQIAQLQLRTKEESRPIGRFVWRGVMDSLQWIGAIALSPFAFLEGLARLRRPTMLFRQILADTFGVGTQLFSLVGCLLIAATASYFIFQQMPKPELVEPILMPEILQATGHTLVRVVLPLAACALVTAKLGAAQSARLASAVRGGLRETLALARWRIEAFGLVPTVIAQIAAMLMATTIACFAGLSLAALIYLATHPRGSLDLAASLMLSGLDVVPGWRQFLITKVVASGFLGGAVASLFGLLPANSEDDVARAVHRTLLWSVLSVIGCQCALIVAEFARS